MNLKEDVMIRLSQVKKSFKDKQVLIDINFEVKKGEIFALIGPNGAGKTTTLKLIGGLLRPTGGRVEVLNVNNPEMVKSKIFMLNEGRIAFYEFKVSDYKELYQSLYPSFNEKLFDNIIVHYLISPDERVDKLSAGMKTLFFLALGMASGAEILLLDEPTHNLDPIKKDEVLKLIRNFSQERDVAIVISSHEIYELEEVISSFAVIREGKVLYRDTLDNAKDSHRIVGEGETIPGGEIIAHVEGGTLIKTNEDVGKYPGFKDIVVGYLRRNMEISLFE